MKAHKHIAVIRLSALGDVAMTVPVLRMLTATHPQLKITMVSKPFLQPLFDSLPNVRFLAAEVQSRHKGIRGLYRLYKEMKALDIDAVADLHNVLRAQIVGQLFRLSGTPVAVLDKGRKEKKALTRSHNKIFQQLPTTVERYARVFEQLGFALERSSHQFPERNPPAERVVALLGSESGKHRIGIAPFAAQAGKMYPLEKMEQVIAALDKKGISIYLFGGGATECKLLEALAGRYENTQNIAGKLLFREELNLIQQLDAMVAMDSGNAHLSAIFGLPTLTLWGVTHPFAGFYPFGQPMENALLADREKFPLIPTSVYGNRFPKGYEKAIETIAPEVVVEKVIAVLTPTQKREPKPKPIKD